MTAKIVVDTSVLIKWFKTRDEELVGEACELLGRIERRGLQVNVPALLLYELGNLLLLKTHLDAESLALAIDQVWNLPYAVVNPQLHLLRRAARLGRELKVTFYDASFLALAEQLDCLFVTADRRLYDCARNLPRVRHLSKLDALS